MWPLCWVGGREVARGLVSARGRRRSEGRLCAGCFHAAESDRSPCVDKGFVGPRSCLSYSGKLPVWEAEDPRGGGWGAGVTHCPLPPRPGLPPDALPISAPQWPST